MYQKGDRVLVFDHLSYKNDVDTPLSMTMKPATVIRQYAYRLDEDVIDVVFDHRPEKESKAHFVPFVRLVRNA